MSQQIEEIHAKALADAQAKSDRFFERQGMNKEDVLEARAAHTEFCEREAKHGKHFFTSPLGFRAFAVGYFIRKQTGNSPTQPKG